jgi:GST-like protein
MDTWTLHGRPAWGSALIEAQLDLYGLPWTLQDSGDLLAEETARRRLQPLNPLGQIPVLVAPDGLVLTESAAITLHLADRLGRDDLVPGPQATERADFLRWLVFLVANIYPTFTYGDVPERFVPEAAAAEFRARVDAHGRRLWGMVEAAAGRPHFLGARFSALDIYLAVMTRWRPGRDWFAENTPMLYGATLRAAEHAAVAAMLARNFPPAEAPEAPAAPQA